MDLYNSFLVEYGAESLVALLKEMLYLRLFEEKIVEVYPKQEMKSPVHLYIGQEAIAVGFCAHLEKEDYLFTTHRSHGHCLAKGADSFSLYAEFYGRIDGCARGRGGSMHPVYPELGIMGTTSIVGGGIPLAVGAAWAADMKRTSQVSVCFFGDGAVEEGTFHESMNFAALKKLPVIFVCENNFYAVASPLSQRQPDVSIAEKGAAYGIEGVEIDGNNIFATYESAKVAIDKARQGGGPTLIECKTFRWKGHVGPDCDSIRGCRPKSEIEKWMKRCPVEFLKGLLLAGSVITENDYQKWADELNTELDISINRARDSNLPEPEELLQNVYYARD